MSDVNPSDDELVSAYLDGEASAVERARVEGDPALLARVEELRAVMGAISAPVAPPDERAREAAIERALAEHPAVGPGRSAAGGSPAVVIDFTADAARRNRRRTLLVAAAAALLVLMGLPLLLRERTSTQTASEAPTSAPSEAAPDLRSRGADRSKPVPDEAAGSAHDGDEQAQTTTIAGPNATTSSAGVSESPAVRAFRGDLGPITDTRALRQTALGSLGDGAAGEAPRVTSTSGDLDAASLEQLDACSRILSGTDRELGELMITARATHQGANAFVLVYAIRNEVTNANGDHRAYLVAPSTCAVLLTSTF